MRADLLAAERSARLRRRVLVVLVVPALLAALVVAAVSAATGGVTWLLPARGRADQTPPSPVVAARPAPLPAAAPPPPIASALKTRPLSAWLADVARDAGRDVVISPELRGDLTASEGSPLDWRQRLDAYARVFGFDFTVDEGLIEVTRAGARRDDPVAAGPVVATQGGRDDSPRRGDDAADAVASPGTAAAAAPEASPPLQTRVVHLSYSGAKDTATVLGHAGKALDVTVSPDPSTNSMVLSGTSASLSRVLAVVKELDRPRRRILLDAKIVEVTRSARLDLGVEWKITGTKVGGEVKFPPPATDAGSAALLIATGGASALDARISALEASGKLHVVSRPSVVMMEGSPATIESARILRIRLPSRGAVVADDVVESPASDRATEEIPVGVRLEVTPAIRGVGRVLLRIKAKSSSLGAPLPPDDIPEELSRMVDAEVLVGSGETAVLGGLTRESGTHSGSGVPGLRRVPLAGLLFGKKSDEKEEEELLVIVTPRVLD